MSGDGPRAPAGPPQGRVASPGEAREARFGGCDVGARPLPKGEVREAASLASLGEGDP
jgi:hypothetical protein